MPLFAATALVMVIGVVIMMVKVDENKFCAEKEELSPNEEEKREGETVKLSKDKQRSLVFMLASIFLWFFGYNAIVSAYSNTLLLSGD